jgi:type IV pilus assembly protein PilA
MIADRKRVFVRWCMMRSAQGFTLVELLVVIVIIGLLTAIALPSFLNQTAKAKQSEAKQNIGVTIRGQQLWYSERSSFADRFDDLALGNVLRGPSGNANTSNYDYQMAISSGANTRLMTIVASSSDTSLRSYTGALSVERTNSQEAVWGSLICSSFDVGSTSVVPANSSSCPAGFKPVTSNDPS